MKIVERIKNYFKHHVVYIHDKFFDYMTDNYDLYDPITIVKVTYSRFRGIIDIEMTSRQRESDINELAKFYHICDINEFGGLKEYNKYSIYTKFNKNHVSY